MPEVSCHRPPSDDPVLQGNSSSHPELVQPVPREPSACQECGSTFASQRGLSLHRRAAHPNAYHQEIVTQRVKARWSSEEEFILARTEVRLLLQPRPPRFINQALLELHSDRTLGSIKCHRKSRAYRDLVQRLLLESPPGEQAAPSPTGPTSSTNAAADALPSASAPDSVEGSVSVLTSPPAGSMPEANEDNVDPASMDSNVVPPARRRHLVIIEELRKLATRSPPQSFQASRLFDVARQATEGEDVTQVLNDYIRDVFTSA
ncbi:uncharacterized protein LOC135373392 [Ornithodoros turicata]|uniref:uncharacterized protein LOC135373392 n=1 Tax=Ornithodoros turicata TaxID=34597 RepID=UPI0031395F77